MSKGRLLLTRHGIRRGAGILDHYSPEERYVHGRRSRAPDGEGSPRNVYLLAALFGTAALLVIFEAVLLTSPAKDVVRTLFPALADVTAPALAGIMVMVTFGAVAVVVCARESKKYFSLKALAEVVGTDDEGVENPFEKPSPTSAQAWALLAVGIQFVLMVFQVDTDDSWSRGVFVLVSVVVVVLAAALGLLEFRRYDIRPDLIDVDQARGGPR